MRQYRKQAGAGTGDQLVKALASARKLLAAAAQVGIVNEVSIKPDSHSRFLGMSKDKQQALLADGDPTVESYLAALEYSGEVVSEMTAKRVEKALKVKRSGRPELIDTPEARAEALKRFGIDV